MLSPTGQYVPRSTSLSSHGSTPQTVPPIRSKTDAEEQRRGKMFKAHQLGVQSGGSSIYDNETPVSTMALDLPTLPPGPRPKPFNPGKLAEIDYDRCSEPWALSGIAAWVKEVGEHETDLKEKTIV